MRDPDNVVLVGCIAIIGIISYLILTGIVT